MEDSSRKFENALGREGLREVLIQQYLLHEVKHHPPVESRGGQPVEVIPRAHTLVDIYKCLHQGEFGVGHIMDNPAAAREGLTRELFRAESGAPEPIFEKIAPDGSVLRINLRPYREIFGGDEVKGCDLLLQVCLDSAGIEKGNTQVFLATLAEFRDLNKKGELTVEGMTFKFPPRMVEDFLSEVSNFLKGSGGVPVLSHSTIYRYLNAPSYRVVDLAALRHSPLAHLLKQ